MGKIFIPIAIYLLFPLTGLLLFWKIKRKMIVEQIVSPPVWETFIVFATYGALLLVVLTSLFWQWSGMASLGTFYLILGAPVAMGIIAYNQDKKKKISKYHEWVFRLSLLYFAIAPLVLLGLYYTGKV